VRLLWLASDLRRIASWLKVVDTLELMRKQALRTVARKRGSVGGGWDHLALNG